MEQWMSRKITSPLIALAALVGAGSLAACNTVEGVGEDVEQAGETIDDTAEDLNDGNPNTP
jgi:predicted small secreted protein